MSNQLTKTLVLAAASTGGCRPISECILWERGRSGDGYGVTSRNGSVISTHRAAWLDAGQELLKGHILHHVCGVKTCINVDHLEQMTAGEHSSLHNRPKLVCDKCGTRRRYRPDRKNYRCPSCHNAKERERYHRSTR